MTDSVLNVVLGVVATAISAGFGWLAQTLRRRRRLEKVRRFFGMPPGTECLLVVPRHPASGSPRSVSRDDVYALMELSALVRECGARAELVAHDQVRRGLGNRTEFCLGGPDSNDRTAAHLASRLPGAEFTVEDTGGPHGVMAIVAGGEKFTHVHPTRAFVLLARIRAGSEGRPVFVIAGQTSTSNHAAVRYLTAHHGDLARKYGHDGTFVLVLRVVDPGAYGPDVVELAADVTARALTAPVPSGV